MFLISREDAPLQRNASDEVTFLLWTRSNPVAQDYIKIGDVDSLNTSHFDSAKKTKVLVHGYSDTGTTGWVINVKNTYLNKGKKIQPSG